MAKNSGRMEGVRSRYSWEWIDIQNLIEEIQLSPIKIKHPSSLILTISLQHPIQSNPTTLNPNPSNIIQNSSTQWGGHKPSAIHDARPRQKLVGRKLLLAGRRCSTTPPPPVARQLVPVSARRRASYCSPVSVRSSPASPLAGRAALPLFFGRTAFARSSPGMLPRTSPSFVVAGSPTSLRPRVAAFTPTPTAARRPAAC